LGLVLSGGPAHAGGSSVPVRITAFSRTSSESATFVLAGISTDVMLHCPEITVVAQYSLWAWPWSKPVVTRSQHVRARDDMAQDFAAQTDTRFGIMGTGLGADPKAGACHFRSRALAIEEEYGGRQVVYSFFKT
jgi:hypothetical protein